MPEQRKQDAKITLEKNQEQTRPTFTTAYGPKRHAPLTFPATEGRTRQEFKAESDINVIMKRYAATGVLEYLNKKQPQYADVTGHDYQAAMDLVANARTAFEELPSSLRARFENDPGQLLDFVNDPENYEEAAELGLLQPEKVAQRAREAAHAAQAARDSQAAPQPPKPQEQAQDVSQAGKPAAKQTPP